MIGVTMTGKVLFIAGMAVGYVLGARAGRKKYEQIRERAKSLWNSDAIQKSVNHAQGFAKNHVGDFADGAVRGARRIISTATGAKTNASSGDHPNTTATG